MLVCSVRGPTWSVRFCPEGCFERGTFQVELEGSCGGDQTPEQQYPPGHLFHMCTAWEEPRLWGGNFSLLEARTFKWWDQLPLEVMFSLLWSHLARGRVCVPLVEWEGGWNDLIWEFKFFNNPQNSLPIKTQDELVAGRAGKGRQGLFQEAPLGSGSLS